MIDYFIVAAVMLTYGILYGIRATAVKIMIWNRDRHRHDFQPTTSGGWILKCECGQKRSVGDI